MVSDKQLREYARKIYAKISGYSFQKASELFPKYLPQIQYYYSLLQKEDRDKVVDNLRIYIFATEGLQAITLINQLQTQQAALQKRFDRIIAEKQYLEKVENIAVEQTAHLTKEEKQAVADILTYQTDYGSRKSVLQQQMEQHKKDYLQLCSNIKNYTQPLLEWCREYEVTGIERDILWLQNSYEQDINLFGEY